MTDQPALFPGYEPPDPPDADLSAGQRLTVRQAADVAAGRHPLTHGRLHPLASRHRDADSPKADPFTCGSCRFRRVVPYHNRAYPKCVWVPTSLDAADVEARGWVPPRVAHSAASDVRAWWPACTDYEPGDTTLSADAARTFPE